MLFIIITCLIFGVWLWKRLKSNPNEPPLCSGYLPLIGHTYQLFGNSNDLWVKAKEINEELQKVDGVIRTEMGFMTFYVVSDPDDCLTVANMCLQKDSIYDFSKPWLGEGLITATLPVWKVHRKLLGPAFSQVVLDGFIEILNKQALRLVEDLAVEVGREPFDVGVYTRNNALQTICMTAMGMDYNDITTLIDKYGRAMEQFLALFIIRFQRVWLHHPKLYGLSGWKKQRDECVKILHDISDKILRKRKADFLKAMNEKTDKGQHSGIKPFMDLLLELSMVKGQLNDQEIREEINTMIAAGHDTSANVLMFTMILIGSYPHVQDQIYKELRDVFGDDARDVTKQDLSQLVYLEAVLKESMRIYPIAPAIVRHIDRDVKLRNCTLYSGRTCFLFLYGMHRHPVWGLDADEFKPERWLDPATLPESATAFAAFSLGRRICIGKAYAYMAMKISLAQVLRNYIVKGDHTKMKLKVDVLLKPISGHHITIESRNSNIYN